GQAAAPQVRVVDDVVVDERRRVDELDHRRVQHGHLAAGVAGEPGGHQHDGRPYPLATALLEVPADLGNQLDAGVDMAEEGLVDALEVGPDWFEQLREVGRGR